MADTLSTIKIDPGYLSKSIKERLGQVLPSSTFLNGVLTCEETRSLRLHVEGGAQLGDVDSPPVVQACIQTL